MHCVQGDAALSPRLQYLCHKNVAVLEFEAHAYDVALQYFANVGGGLAAVDDVCMPDTNVSVIYLFIPQALELDGTDVVVWYQMGKTAMETGKYERTFKDIIDRSCSLTPLTRSRCA